MGPAILNIFQYISNKMQLYTVYLYLETVPHVSGGTTTHHQDRIQLYLQHLVFVRPFLLPAAIAAAITLHLVGYILEYSYDTRTHERYIRVKRSYPGKAINIQLYECLPVCNFVYSA